MPKNVKAATKPGEVLTRQREDRVILEIRDPVTGQPLLEIWPDYIEGKGAVLVFWRKSTTSGREHLTTMTTTAVEAVVPWLPALISNANALNPKQT